MGLPGVSKHSDTNICIVREQLPLPPHTHVAHEHHQIFQAIMDYAQSVFSVKTVSSH